MVESRTVIRVEHPEVERQITYTVTGNTIVDFAVLDKEDGEKLSRHGNDLHILFQDGAVVIIAGFYGEGSRLNKDVALRDVDGQETSLPDFTTRHQVRDERRFSERDDRKLDDPAMETEGRLTPLSFGGELPDFLSGAGGERGEQPDGLRRDFRPRPDTGRDDRARFGRNRDGDDVVTQQDRAVETEKETTTATPVIQPGENVAPVVLGTSDLSGAVTEASHTSTLTDSGLVFFSDTNLSDSHTLSSAFKSSSHTRQLGELVVSLDGDTAGGIGGQISWHYEVDNTAMNFLAKGQNVTETFTVSVSDGQGGTVERDISVVITGTDDKVVWTDYQAAQHITRVSSWADYTTDLNIKFSFPDGSDSGFAPHPFHSSQQALTREALEVYAEISGLTFTEITDNDGSQSNFAFRNQDTNGGGGYSTFPANGVRTVNIGRRDDSGDQVLGNYTSHLIYHETGHALGLHHPGPYNGYGYTYAADANHWNDSRQYSQQSYWTATETGGSTNSLSTPGLHDILAIQIEYGINWATRTGDNTYGYHAATDGQTAYDFTVGASYKGFSIWDGGGTDTLDFSGSAANTVLDLRQGTFSSVNDQTYNVSIAYGAVIENAVGSGSDDIITGNAVNNVLRGGSGQDTIRGGEDHVFDATPDVRHFTGIQLNESPLVRDQYLSVESVRAFSLGAVTVEMMVDVTRMPSNDLMLASYGTGSSSAANSFVIYGDNDSTFKVKILNSVIDTGISTETLIDGVPHRVSVSWDQPTGALSFYIDGIRSFSGTHQAGAAIPEGGVLVFGQEQNSLGGGFNPQQIFPGTIGDIRIFNDIRTSTEIADNAFTTLTGSEQGLLHNWQVKAGDTTTVTDVAVANPPVNLTDLLPGRFTVTQSSAYNSDSGAERVLDNDAGTWNHTLNSGDEWLLVAFDQVRDITSIKLGNRIGQQGRLNGATVSVLDAQGNTLYVSDPVTGAGDSLAFTFPQTLAASAVRIDQDTNYLHITELDIFGPVPEGVSVDPALLNTDLAIKGGGTVNNTAPVVDTSADNDILYGEQGNDTLYGGWGNDTLYGHGGDVAQDSRFAETAAVTLNNGATDQYLGIANYSGLSGANSQVQFTLEMLVSGLSGYNELVSYANNQSSNAFLISLNDNANISILYRGSSHDTGIASSVLTDGGEHRFSISWDGSSSSSQYIIYVDGQEVGHGTHARQNYQLDSGTLIFGQEQDSIGGSFSSSQILKGSIGDIRVFDDVRTAQEISDNAFAPLTDPANTQGLVSNWQVASNSVTGSNVADVTGGTALTLNGAATLITLGNVDDDRLYGGLGDDILYGNGGDDLLNGGLGSDRLTGGAGADTFVLDTTNGIDTITDFVIAEDLLDISALLDANFGDANKGDYVQAVESGGNTTLSVNADGQGNDAVDIAILEGVSAADVLKIVFDDQDNQVPVIVA